MSKWKVTAPNGDRVGREGNAYRNAWEKGYDYAIEEAHDAIRQALGEVEQ